MTTLATAATPLFRGSLSQAVLLNGNSVVQSSHVTYRVWVPAVMPCCDSVIDAFVVPETLATIVSSTRNSNLDALAPIVTHVTWSGAPIEYEPSMSGDCIARRVEDSIGSASMCLPAATT